TRPPPSPPLFPYTTLFRSRYLSSLALVLELIRHAAKDPGERAAAVVGRLVAHLATLRQMSLSVAVMLQAGENPNLEAAVVKDVRSEEHTSELQSPYDIVCR